jgi:Ca2+-transporting ATPase
LSEPLIGRAQLLLGLAQGTVLLLVCLALYAHLITGGAATELARTLAFVALTAGNLMLVRANARHRRAAHAHGGRGYWMIAVFATATVALCIGVPVLRDLFGFALPPPAALATAVALGLLGGASLLPFKTSARVQRWLGTSPG